MKAAAKQSAATRTASDERKDREAKYRAAAPALLQAWLAGRELTAEECNIMEYGCMGLDYARLVGGNAVVETTQGASIAVAHIRRAIPSIDRAIASGQEWRTNGHTIRLGGSDGYELTYISADGIIHVGCHAFQRSEYERIRAMILDLPNESPKRCKCGARIEGPYTICYECYADTYGDDDDDDDAI